MKQMPWLSFFPAIARRAFRGEPADLGLGEVADGEAGVADLLLAQEGEKVRLVLVLVRPLEQGEGAGFRETPRVVAGGDRRKAVLLRPGQEQAELDLPVAEDVRIRGEAAGIAVEQALDDQLPVFPHQVDHLELDPDLLGDPPGVGDVLLPGAAADDVVLVDPVLHVRPRDVASLLLQEQRRDGAVDSAGHGDEDLFSAGHGNGLF